VASGLTATLDPVSFAIVLAILLPVFLSPIAAMVSAGNHSPEEWAAIGRSRGWWTLAFFLYPLGIAPVAALIYFAAVRPRFPAGPDLARGSTVVPQVTLNAGRVATVTRRLQVLRPFGMVWIEFADTGERQLVFAQHLRASGAAPVADGAS
jgi:hypothetical protein